MKKSRIKEIKELFVLIVIGKSLGKLSYAGVVSDKPGLRMNDGMEQRENKYMLFICLKGRTPVKINGKAKKGDYIVADDNGRGKSIGNQPQDMHNLIGISLEDGVDIIEVKV